MFVTEQNIRSYQIADAKTVDTLQLSLAVVGVMTSWITANVWIQEREHDSQPSSILWMKNNINKI